MSKFHQLEQITKEIELNEPDSYLEDDTMHGYTYGKPMKSANNTSKAKKKKGKKSKK